MIDTLPKKVVVRRVLSSRYEDLIQEKKLTIGEKPASWDDRVAGIDTVLATFPDSSDEFEVKLQSFGDQAVPGSSWVLMLNTGSETSGYEWTLYGFERVVPHAAA